MIGRSKDCDVQLADPNASRRHAELRQEGSAYWLIDLDSTNGSSVNGHRTARAKLDTGDVITIGSTELLFERRLARVTVIGSLAVGEALLILKILFLLLLYLFIWRIVRTASRDLRLPQESFVLAPEQAAGLLGAVEARRARVASSSPTAGSADSTRARSRSAAAPRTTSRWTTTSPRRATPASSRRRDGVWVSDAGSTNGTYVNGAKLSKPHRLEARRRVRVGNTDLRYER